jgi:hypothetical protein
VNRRKLLRQILYRQRLDFGHFEVMCHISLTNFALR